MFQLKALIVTFGLLLLNSCEIVEEESGDTNNVAQETRYLTRVLIENESISNEELFIANVNEGDTILLEITGTVTSPKFSSIYNKHSTSTWEERICYNTDDVHNGRLPKMKAYSCFWSKRKGKCNSQFMDYQGKLKEKIYFDLNQDEPRLSYFIGEKEFLFEANESSDVYTLKASIKITEDLIKNSNGFSLKAHDIVDSSSTRTGFLGHLSCQGQGQPRFSPNISKSSQNISNQNEFSYLVTAKVKYLE